MTPDTPEMHPDWDEAHKWGKLLSMEVLCYQHNHPGGMLPAHMVGFGTAVVWCPGGGPEGKPYQAFHMKEGSEFFALPSLALAWLCAKRFPNHPAFQEKTGA